MKKRVIAAVMVTTVILALLVGCQKTGMVQNTGASANSQPVLTSQPIENIGRVEAINVVKHTINMDYSKYQIDLVNDNLKYNGQEYFQFLISDSKTSIEPSIIVSKENGAAYCYYPDHTVTEVYQDSVFKSRMV